MSRRAEWLFAALLALAPGLVLAQTALPPVAAGTPHISSGISVLVREYRVRGNTVLSPEELARALAPYVGRVVDSEELLRARDALTQLYLERGYLGSGAVLPDQEVRDGVVELRVVEGRLGTIEVRGARNLTASRVREQLQGASDGPLQIAALERRLQRLQRDPLIRRVDAHLAPGVSPGESALDLRIEEERPWQYSFELANDISSSLGGQRAGVELTHLSLTGRGDRLVAGVSAGQGLRDFDLSYSLPFSSRDTRLELGVRRSLGDVVRGDFEDAVDSERTSYGATLVQPLLGTARDELEIGLGAELRRGEVRLFDSAIALFPSEVSSRGESRVTALRAFQSWVHRRPDQVLALRLTQSLGLDLFDASVRPGGSTGSEADARFFVALAQLRWALQLPGEAGLQLVGRADLQLSPDPLLPLERWSVGGADSVRGYPENQMVRDNALVASLELRVPLLRDWFDRPVLELAPFVDFGRGWNRERGESLRSIASAGLGLRWAPSRWSVELYWGARLRDVDRRDAEGLQDMGVHARVRLLSF